jgi:molecular chaperone HtpG
MRMVLAAMPAEKYAFQAEVSQVLRLVIHSLYSNKEIFLRELLSNASDAIDRRRFLAIERPELVGDGERLLIRLIPDAEAKTLTIWDNGLGMDESELKEHLGTVAFSGSRRFLENVQANPEKGQDLPKLIGQFGVGFYSAYLVAERVSVTSRKAGTDQAFRWESSGEEGFSIEPCERESAGTSVTLKLKEEHAEYLEALRLKELVRRYSDYVPHPIELVKGPADESGEVVNRANALWQRQPKDVKEDEYVEFYKHLAHDWQEPLAHRHFHIEGTQMFSGLLFVPKRAPLDLFEPNPNHGVRLHVRRVLVMENAEELVPRWLRFVKGVIDSEDLPLNVSRELLQDSRLVRAMRKQVVSQTLDLLKQVASERPDDYVTFWKSFGAVLKEGLHFEPEQKAELLPLLRFESAALGKQLSLDEYVAAMPEGQPGIYYLLSAQRSAASAPHLEQARARGYDVLLLTDPVDPFVMEVLDEYKDKPFRSLSAADLDLDGKKADEDAGSKESSPLVERSAKVLENKVLEVKPSVRLTDSPACLVVPEGGLPPHLERLMRASGREMPASRRVLELNLKHPLVQRLAELETREPGSDRVADWIHLLYDQALLAEGSPPEDPAAFAKRLSRVMTAAAGQELSEAEAPAQEAT